MFCHHHDEAEVYGSEPVPCPFCGYGASDQAEGEPEETAALAIDDSNEALRNALFDVETETTTLKGYW